jgi:hypothetical protein
MLQKKLKLYLGDSFLSFINMQKGIQLWLNGFELSPEPVYVSQTSDYLFAAASID